MGAFMNVRINAAGYDDKNYVAEIVKKGTDIQNKAIAMEAEIVKRVNDKIGL